MCSSLKDRFTLDPADLIGFGIKNITDYRDLFNHVVLTALEHGDFQRDTDLFNAVLEPGGEQRALVLHDLHH